ncbi:MAG: hypothetical protein ONB44_20270 [candidate division KSB1 bacterium]|nr:hypothetical protein [candidate division KSB1 bacterium]MDZ7312973.1 hypothetical protein [candidate division KSB1 bacterium]
MPVSQQQKIDDPAHRSRTGKWISALGWLVTMGGGVSLVFGLSDLANLTLLAVGGVVFIPIGLLLIANGQILRGLARLEKNAKTTNAAPPPSDSTRL